MLSLGLLFRVLARGAFLPPSNEAIIGGLAAMNLPLGENTSTCGKALCTICSSSVDNGFQVVVSESSEAGDALRSSGLLGEIGVDLF